MHFFIFVFGLCVGSFLNVVICRLPKNEKIFGRSHCPYCKKTIVWYDLIPVFSFIRLFGKCRFCGKKISWQYPIVEVSTGILFLLATCNLQLTIYNLQSSIQLAYWLLVVSCLVAVFVIDLRHYIIPDEIIYPAIGMAIIFNFQFLIFKQFSIFKHSILGAFGAAAFFLIIFLASKGNWMGVGDIKLAFLMGLVLGFPKILPALFLSFVLGGIMGIGLIILGKKSLKSEVPFGPFLVAGTLITLFWGRNLIDWYLRLIV